MSCDPTFEWCNELEADLTYVTDLQKGGPGAGGPGAGGPGAGGPGAGGKGGKGDAPAEKGGAGAKKGPPEAFVTKVAVKFVNAMWYTMFARVLSVGLQDWQRSTKQYKV